MSQRPINLLEIKSNFHKANTEMNASFETIWNDMAGRVHNLNDTVKVRDAQIEGLQSEITRLRALLPSDIVNKNEPETPPV